jgi:23S rRNA pseudouridine2605 synthase
MEIRLQKYFTDCGVLSRRAAEQEILAGRVTVNGETAHMGQRILPGVDRVLWQGRELQMPTQREFHYILLHKPRGVLTTMSDDRGRPTVADLVRDLGTRVYPVGRLDMDSDGLLLLTNDGDLANLLSHPSHEVDKVYLAYVAGNVTAEQMNNMTRPIEIDGKMTSPARVRKAAFNQVETALEVTIHDGRNRQVRRLCEREGLRVLKLTRVAEGPLLLGDLEEGKWRRLSDKEIRKLKGTN